jgi:D-alanyl-D-alanine carboxypeptidase (penicillin-binding protein 5/6)
MDEAWRGATLQRLSLPLLTFVVLLLVLSPVVQAQENLGAWLEAEGVVLMAEPGGKILYEKNSGERFYPASTTKIMTALLLLEHTSPDEMVTVGEEVFLVGPDSSTSGLTLGDRIRVGDLLYAVMLPSGNEAAYAAAVYAARQASSRPEMPVQEALDYFTSLMNDRARDLGALHTHFANPDGYHDPDHYTTANDLALIAREALKKDLLRQAARAKVHQVTVWRDGSPVTLEWFTTNWLLHPDLTYYYPRATGLKTGHTPEAGGTLVATAVDGDLELIAVLMKSTTESRFQEAASLFDYGFDHFRLCRVVEKGEAVAVAALKGQAKGEEASVPAFTAAGFSDVLPAEDIPRIEKNVTWESRLLSGEALKAPLEEGEVIGRVSYTLDGTVLFETELLSGCDVRARFPWEKTALPAVLVLGLFTLVRRRRRKAVRSRRGTRTRRA